MSGDVIVYASARSGVAGGATMAAAIGSRSTSSFRSTSVFGASALTSERRAEDAVGAPASHYLRACAQHDLLVSRRYAEQRSERDLDRCDASITALSRLPPEFIDAFQQVILSRQQERCRARRARISRR